MPRLPLATAATETEVDITMTVKRARARPFAEKARLPSRLTALWMARVARKLWSCTCARWGGESVQRTVTWNVGEETSHGARHLTERNRLY